MASYTTVDEYIRSCPEETHAILQNIRKLIKEAAPEAVESISYGVAGYKLNGKPLLYFGGWKSHIGFYATPAGNAAFQKDIEPYKKAKGSIQFPLSQPIPYELIRRMTEFRVNEVRSTTGDKKGN